MKISEKKTLDWNFRYIRSIFSARRHFFQYIWSTLE